ncbi:cytochrome o ubiquinol oxidase subunit 2 [Kushneria sinocarnis]|uniref:Cytochrome o ubiquinol oxidase subunit 2 n=1 Tax=Kushneria sinocarnis TaxID=595502 RepID=A0A420WZC8_9GAMM|nr:cytochrome ubiquinol oxidase subunit II [Kushneria sinocarnis]RKR06693.1 cytochrome o ubiquinol oxidase subunit 2 [Kushneria sinocarnis]
MNISNLGPVTGIRGNPGTRLIRCWITLLSITLLAGCSDGHISFLDPQGPIARAQYEHFWFVIGMCLIVVLPVFIFTPLIAWRYRYHGKAVYKPSWAFSKVMDTLIWGVPFVVVAIMSVVLWQQTTTLDPYKPLDGPQKPLQVEVVGFDWKWLFIYPDQGIATVGRLVIPADRPISFRLTSASVMQTFFIPALGSQMDVMNRMVTRLHLKASHTGTFKGRNMQYNGRGFHKQQFDVDAVSPEAFDEFVQRVKQQGQPLGRQAYTALSRRGTSEDVARALGLHGDTVRFSRVSGALFSTIVNSAHADWAAPVARPPRAGPAATTNGDSTHPGTTMPARAIPLRQTTRATSLPQADHQHRETAQ